MNARSCSQDPFKSYCLQSFASFHDVESTAPLYDTYNESSETEPSHNCHITFSLLSRSILIASPLLTTFTSMSPNPSADSHWHDQPPMSTQDPYREDQQEEMPSKIFNRVAERLAKRHRLKYGNIPASHQDLPEQAHTVGDIGDPAPEDQSHRTSSHRSTENLPQRSIMNTFGEVVGRVYYQAVAAEAVASQPQTTHGASTAQKSSNNPDQGNKSIGPPNDKVSGENA
jgi:hypothetical protein